MVKNADLEGSYDHAPIPLYNAQRREYLRNHNAKDNKKAKKLNDVKDVDSGDLRCFKGKKGRFQPISIRIDRFGRIAFNKNKELSQASFDKPENEGMAAKSNSSNEEHKGQQSMR